MNMTINETIFRYLNNLAGQSTFFDSIIVFLAEDLIFWMIAGMFLLIIAFIYIEEIKKEVTPEQEIRWRDLAKHSLIALFAGALAWSVSEIIKYYYFSPRPFLALTNVNLLFQHGGVDSFPSGHAITTFAVSSVLYIYHKKLGITYLILSVIVVLARVTSGVHWPSDIMAGALLGIIIAILLNSILKLIPTTSNKQEN